MRRVATPGAALCARRGPDSDGLTARSRTLARLRVRGGAPSQLGPVVRQAGDSHAWVVAPGPASFPTPARAVKPGGESDGPGRPPAQQRRADASRRRRTAVGLRGAPSLRGPVRG